jgi:hypothetical protein
MEEGYHIFIGEDSIGYKGAALGLERQIHEVEVLFTVQKHGGCAVKTDENTKSLYLIIHACTLTKK